MGTDSLGGLGELPQVSTFPLCLVDCKFNHGAERQKVYLQSGKYGGWRISMPKSSLAPPPSLAPQLEIESRALSMLGRCSVAELDSLVP